MTEEEWLVSTDPQAMLGYLSNRFTQRKLRSFALACCRRIWHLLDPGERRLVDAIDHAVRRNQGRAYNFLGLFQSGRPEPDFIRATVVGAANQSACVAATRAASAGAVASADPVRERLAQADLLRDIFGNPFQPVPFPQWWVNTHRMEFQSEAEAIFRQTAFDRLPSLADRLQEAGMKESAIVAHCREPGIDVRGCWVIDALLGKAREWQWSGPQEPFYSPESPDRWRLAQWYLDALEVEQQRREAAHHLEQTRKDAARAFVDDGGARHHFSPQDHAFLLSRRKSLLFCYIVCQRKGHLNAEQLDSLAQFADTKIPRPQFCSYDSWHAELGSVSYFWNYVSHAEGEKIVSHLVGNPFKPYPAPSAWPTAVIELAQALYDGADDRLILADALEEAGHGELAAHFRSEEWHPKGCFVMDLILGKE